MCYTQICAVIGAVARMWVRPYGGAIGIAAVERFMNNINILLLRGVNVGGSNRLPMAEFRAFLGEIGLARVQTHIQSGNAVFDGNLDGLEEKIAAGMKLRFGFAPRLFFLPLAEYDAILSANPFANQGAAEGKSVHIFFLASSFDPADAKGLAALAAQGEQIAFTPRAAYLFAPMGVGRSVLAEKLGQTRKVDLTARNYTSAVAISALAHSIKT